MRDAEIVSKAAECLAEVTGGTPYTVYDLEFVKEGPNRYLRVFIDKDGGVGIDDCERVSRALEKKLDERDFIDCAYMLEVSSPGIYRRLKKGEDFVRYIGRAVDFKLFKPLALCPGAPGVKEYRGELKNYDNGIITVALADGGGEISFAVSDAASVRLSAV